MVDVVESNSFTQSQDDESLVIVIDGSGIQIETNNYSVLTIRPRHLDIQIRTTSIG